MQCPIAFSLSHKAHPSIYTLPNHSIFPILFLLSQSLIFASLFISMALFLSFLLFLLFPSTNADWPPSPGYWPSSKFRSMSFHKGFRNLWGPNHQSVDQNALTIWLDRTSGLILSSINFIN